MPNHKIQVLEKCHVFAINCQECDLCARIRYFATLYLKRSRDGLYKVHNITFTKENWIQVVTDEMNKIPCISYHELLSRWSRREERDAKTHSKDKT